MWKLVQNIHSIRACEELNNLQSGLPPIRYACRSLSLSLSFYLDSIGTVRDRKFAFSKQMNSLNLGSTNNQTLRYTFIFSIVVHSLHFFARACVCVLMFFYNHCYWWGKSLKNAADNMHELVKHGSASLLDIRSNLAITCEYDTTKHRKLFSNFNLSLLQW